MEFVNLPTGKPHISYSELGDWKQCTYRHKLKYVDKIILDKPSPILDFGKCTHQLVEIFLKTGELKLNDVGTYLQTFWDEGKENKDPIIYTPKLFESDVNTMKEIISEVPEFLDKTFPNWKLISAEQQLYEPIVKWEQHAFKGFIDCVIECDARRGKDKRETWIVDWKTSASGWRREQRSDQMKMNQIILYGNYWAQKEQRDMKGIRCGFGILKKSAKKNAHCEFIPVSMGDVSIKRAVYLVESMLSTVNRGIAIRNLDSCKYCPYSGTKHCQ